MINALFPLLVVMLLAWLWLDSSRAREFANVLAQRYCNNRGMQFLDQTVALCRVGLRWTSSGLRIRRMFRFDFSLEGAGRHTGYVLMLGAQLEAIDDGLPRDDEPEAATPPIVPTDDPKVVPFRRRDR
jgi:hypothetical protein